MTIHIILSSITVMVLCVLQLTAVFHMRHLQTAATRPQRKVFSRFQA